ncbi:MAG: endonuclease III domain-containing protein [Candidatus Aenigmatarchaeota archaeon]
MEKLREIHSKLMEEFEGEEWWPHNSKFEVIVGAILTQNTSWENVQTALDEMKEKDIMDMKSIVEIDREELEETIRSSGYYKQKAKRLKRISKHIFQDYDSVKEFFEGRDIDELREELLNIKGIGKETADAMILYAGERPTFVVDAYTKRVFGRIGMDVGDKYDEIKAFFEENLPSDPKLYDEYHGLLIELAKEYCKKKPECKGCPISHICGYFEKNTIKIKGNKN